MVKQVARQSWDSPVQGSGLGGSMAVRTQFSPCFWITHMLLKPPESTAVSAQKSYLPIVTETLPWSWLTASNSRVSIACAGIQRSPIAMAATNARKRDFVIAPSPVRDFAGRQPTVDERDSAVNSGDGDAAQPSSEKGRRLAA